VRALLVTMLALVALAPGGARADGGVRLDWIRGDGAESCADGAALEALVRAELGRDPFGPPFEYSVEGAAAMHLDRVVARLRLRSAARGALGDRIIEAADCAALTPALVLALALAIDELAPAPAEREAVETDEPSPEPAHDPPLEEVAAALDALAAGPRLASPPGEPLEGSLSVLLPISIGVLPRPAVGVGLGGGVQYGRWVLDLAVRYFPEVGLSRGASEYAFSWIALGLASGLVLRIDRVELAGLAGLDLGALSAHSLQRAAPDAGTEPTVAPLLAARARYLFADFLALELTLTGTAPLARHGYFVRGTEVLLFEQAPLAFSAALSVAGVFGRAR
jgi:hypothetical protein